MGDPTGLQSDPTYLSYLQVDRLLDLQRTLSKPTEHDELIFIVTHQASELWFKVMLHDLDEVYRLMASRDVSRATRLLNRVLEIEALLIQQTRIIERMLPTDFIKFRDFLGTASGLQSVQFREIEFLSGLKDERFLSAPGFGPLDSRRLKKRIDAPSLWDGFLSILAVEGLDVQLSPGEKKLDKDERVSRKLEVEVRAVTALYSSGSRTELVALAEALLTHDENFALWRYLHMAIVERMIGQKPGTGRAQVEEMTGRSLMGVEYLKDTQSKRFFPALWLARTSLTNA